jgi:hypothetical protein
VKITCLRHKADGFYKVIKLKWFNNTITVAVQPLISCKVQDYLSSDKLLIEHPLLLLYEILITILKIVKK